MTGQEPSTGMSTRWLTTMESPIQRDGAIIKVPEKQVKKSQQILEVPVQVLIDRPYGGFSVDLGVSRP